MTAAFRVRVRHHASKRGMRPHYDCLPTDCDDVHCFSNSATAPAQHTAQTRRSRTGARRAAGSSARQRTVARSARRKCWRGETPRMMRPGVRERRALRVASLVELETVFGKHLGYCVVH